MILPTKHIIPRRALITVASEIYELINNRSTVSSIWNDLQDQHNQSLRYGDVSYDWFILSIDFLFIIGAIEGECGSIKRVVNSAS